MNQAKQQDISISAKPTAVSKAASRPFRFRWTQVAAWIVIIIALIFALFPIYWLVLISLRPRADLFIVPPLMLPTDASLDNINTVIFGTDVTEPIVSFLLNSLVISSIATLFATLLGAMCAYAIVRFRTGGNFLATWILAQRYMPPVVIAVPMFLIFRQLQLLDTQIGLIVLYITFNLPLAVWLMVSFVNGLSPEMEQAALVDGAGYFQSFIRVALPLMAPGLAVTAMFTFIFCWNEFLFAFLLAGNRVSTITVYFPRMRSAVGLLYGEIAAASLLSLLPALVFAWVLQRNLARGLTLGGIVE